MISFPQLSDASFDPIARWVLIIVAALTIILAVFRPMLRKRDPMANVPRYASLAQQRSVERQMQNVLVELSEMSRQISAQLDTRAMKLELLIKEADVKIQALRQAAQNLPGGEFSTDDPSSNAQNLPNPGSLTHALAIDPRHAEIYALADQGRSPHEIGQQLNRPSGEIELILALRH